MNVYNVITTLVAYISVRWAVFFDKDRNAVMKRQNAKITRFLARDIGRVDYFKFWDSKFIKLNDLPIIDKAALMGNWERFNCAGVDAETAWAAFGGTKTIGDYTVGASTGTSGNRGLFIISHAEQFKWLGAMLAKTLPDIVRSFWGSGERVAIVLPLNTPLYDSANQSRFLTLKFFDLTMGPETWRGQFEQFNPTTVVAPPKILRWFAERNVKIKPVKIFSAAEYLDEIDRKTIEAHFNVRLGQIYMATEGLLGVSCGLGTLHLCEDTMHFEFEPVGDGLVTPIITDFNRTTQIMARYRMNDVLQLAQTPCGCGSPLQAVRQVIGRMDDCFHFTSLNGKPVLLTPDVLRNAVVDSHREIDDYRIIQIGPCSLELVLPHHCPTPALDAAKSALSALLDQRGAIAEINARMDTLPLDISRKLRRVENRSALHG